MNREDMIDYVFDWADWFNPFEWFAVYLDTVDRMIDEARASLL